ELFRQRRELGARRLLRHTGLETAEHIEPTIARRRQEIAAAAHERLHRHRYPRVDAQHREQSAKARGCYANHRRAPAVHDHLSAHDTAVTGKESLPEIEADDDDGCARPDAPFVSREEAAERGMRTEDVEIIARDEIRLADDAFAARADRGRHHV